MGAGISAGAFAEGFYKGYSLIEKSMADKEERKRKIDAETAALKAKKDELDIAASKFQNDTTKDITKENTNLAKAETEGDVIGINAAKENLTNIIIGSNKVSDTYDKALGTQTKKIDVNTLNLDKIESVEFNGNNYQVPVKNAEFIRGLIAKQNKEGLQEGQVPRVKVADDGTLRVMETDGEGTTINKTMQAFKPLAIKKDSKDSDMMFSWKQYNANLGKDEKPLTLSEFKAIEWDKQSDSPEQRYTDAKTRIETNLYTDSKYGNAQRLADTNIVKKYEQTGQYGQQPKEVSYQLVVGADGTQYVFNPKTAETKIVGKQVTKEDIDTAKKTKEGLFNLGEIKQYVQLVEKVAKDNPTAVTSLGEKPASFLGNKLNDIVGKPTKDREDRAKIQQFSKYMRISLASSVQSGALTQKDVDAFEPFMPSEDDDAATRKSKLAGANQWIARNAAKLNAGSDTIKTLTNKQNTNTNTSPKPVTVIKVWSDAQYEYRKLSNGDIQKKAKK